MWVTRRPLNLEPPVRRTTTSVLLLLFVWAAALCFCFCFGQDFDSSLSLSLAFQFSVVVFSFQFWAKRQAAAPAPIERQLLMLLLCRWCCCRAVAVAVAVATPIPLSWRRSLCIQDRLFTFFQQLASLALHFLISPRLQLRFRAGGTPPQTPTRNLFNCFSVFRNFQFLVAACQFRWHFNWVICAKKHFANVSPNQNCYSFNFNLCLHFMAGFVVAWKLASNLAFIFMQS